MSDTWSLQRALPALRNGISSLLRLTPLLVALGTFVLVVLQLVNGLPAEAIVETAIGGFLVATPVAALLFWPTPSFVPELDLGIGADGSTAETPDGPVSTLRDRYARGEISRETFERRLDGLVETEDVTAVPGDERELHRETE